MRTIVSCNGCRVLRRACGEGCTIRPCLRWIISPESQAHATVFLAKFYGRAGLIKLINAGPDHLCPGIKSFYFKEIEEMTGSTSSYHIKGNEDALSKSVRIATVGLFWSGNWAQCQSAIEAVLRGSSQFSQSPSLDSTGPRHKPCDVRHAWKTSGSGDLHKIRTGTRFKRSSNRAKPKTEPDELFGGEGSKWIYPGPISGEVMPTAVVVANRDSAEAERIFFEETMEATLANLGKPNRMPKSDRPVEESPESQLQLELSLGVKPPPHPREPRIRSTLI